MNDHPLCMTASDAANLLRLSPSTLAKLRLTGRGPAFSKLGRRVVYRREDLTAWLDKNRRHSTSDGTAEPVESARW